MSTYDFFFVLAGVIVVEISEEFVEEQGDFGLELGRLGDLSLGGRYFFGTSTPLFRLYGQHC